LAFGLAHDCDEDLAVPTASAAKAPHDFLQVLMQAVHLLREITRAAAALLRDAGDEF
jgi:hypothetical protein